MKKHVSLFLALLMVVSVFFTTPVAAANLEKDTIEQSHEHDHENVSCTTKLRDVQEATTRANGSGNESNAFAGCAHSYRYVSSNSTQHRRVCTKCGSTTYVNHTFSYTNTGNMHVKSCKQCGYSGGSSQHVLKHSSQSATLHKVYCSLCSYTTSAAHDFKYTNTGNMHVKSCKQCSYSGGSEQHSFSCTGVSIDDSIHRVKCTKCDCTSSSGHKWAYTLPYPEQKEYHFKYCAECKRAIGKEKHKIVHTGITDICADCNFICCVYG